MKPEIPEFISISAAGIWAHLLLLRLALEYYNVSRQYDVIINRIDAPVFLAAFLCVIAFLLHVLARISSRRWGWGLFMNLLLVLLPAYAVYDRVIVFLIENPIRLSQQAVREPIASPSPFPTLAPMWEPTEQWDVYTDPVSHFSIQYPSTWELQQPRKDSFGQREIRLLSNSATDFEETTFILITMIDNPSGLSLDQWIEEYLSPEVRAELQREPITVGGQVGEKVIGLPSRNGTLDVFVAFGQRIYWFMLTPYDPDTPYFAEVSRASAEVFYHMLETITFETE